MSRLRFIGRIARGALGTSIAWALGWAPIGALIGLYRVYITPPHWTELVGRPVVSISFAWAIIGALCALAFAIALALFARRGDVSALSARRAAGLAGVAAALLGAMAVVMSGDFSEFGTTLIVLSILAGLGALFGAATLAVARRSAGRGDSGGPAT